MTNEEAVREALLIESIIAARIDAGEIPPRPTDRKAWRAWYDEHIRCVEHPYAARIRGGDRCAQCVLQDCFAEEQPARVQRRRR